MSEYLNWELVKPEAGDEIWLVRGRRPRRMKVEDLRTYVGGNNSGSEGTGTEDEEEQKFYIPVAGQSPPENRFFWNQLDEFGYPIASWQLGADDQWVSVQTFTSSIYRDEFKDSKPSVLRFQTVCFSSAIRILGFSVRATAKDDMKNNESLNFQLMARDSNNQLVELESDSLSGLRKNQQVSFSVEAFSDLLQPQTETLQLRISGEGTDLLNLVAGVCYRNKYIS